MFAWLRNILGNPNPKRQVRAGYDAAETTDENRRHWAKADRLSADMWGTPVKRDKIRSRCRHEAANNCYARGMIDTRTSDTIGTGPRLQVRTNDTKLNIEIERRWNEWAIAVGLAEKLRLMDSELPAAGESFAMFFKNDSLLIDPLGEPRLMIPLDLRVYEADQIETPNLSTVTDKAVSGIQFDDVGNPTFYHVLKSHPGGMSIAGAMAYDSVPAADMIHYFRQMRPGQRRGIAEIAPAMDLFAQLRRYTKAVLSAAELTAELTGTIESDAPADADGAEEGTPFETIEMERGTWAVMPAGQRASAFKSEQPTTTYKEFKHEVLNEIARCLGLPFNIAIANSSGYNYSSGRLDHQAYFKAIAIRQKVIERVILNRVFARWLELASMLDGYLPAGAPMLVSSLPHEWMWDGFEHVDPLKEANADTADLANHTTTLADLCAKRGKDWESQLRQRARELDLMEELRIPVTAPAGSESAANKDEEEDEDAQKN